MKKIFPVALVSSFLLLAICHSLAQFQWVNQTGTTTNVTMSGSLVTITNVCTNAPALNVRSNNVIVGDPLSVAFTKVNSNINWESNTFNLLSNELAQATNALGIFTNLIQFPGGLTNLVEAPGGLTNEMHLVTNSLGVFLATGEMYFDAGKIMSDGHGNVLLNGGNIFTLTNATTTYYLGADPANPGIAVTAWHQGVESSAIHVQPNLTALVCRQNINGTTYSAAYFDDSGVANIMGGPSAASGFIVNGSGTLDLIDNSGQGQHFDGSGNASFDANVTFIGGAAEIMPDTSGNGGTTLMLQASDNGQQEYIHIDSSGTLTVTTSP